MLWIGKFTTETMQSKKLKLPTIVEAVNVAVSAFNNEMKNGRLLDVQVNLDVKAFTRDKEKLASLVLSITEAGETRNVVTFTYVKPTKDRILEQDKYLTHLYTQLILAFIEITHLYSKALHELRKEKEANGQLSENPSSKV